MLSICSFCNRTRQTEVATVAALVDRGQRTVQSFKKCTMRLEERTREKRRALLDPRTPQPLDERKEGDRYVVRFGALHVPTS
jgi:hypothetical protein